MIMAILKSEKPAEKIADKKAIRRIDPILGKYDEQGILGTKPGMVTKNGKELTVQELTAAEKKEKEDLEKAAREEALLEQRAKEMEQGKRKLEIISTAKSSIEDNIKEGKEEIRNFSLLATFVGLSGPGVIAGGLYASHLVWTPLLCIVGFACISTTYKMLYAAFFDDNFDYYHKNDFSQARNAFGKYSAWKVEQRVLDAFEKGEPITDRDLMKAVNLDGDLRSCLKALAEEADSTEAKALLERAQAIILEKKKCKIEIYNSKDDSNANIKE